MKVALYARVSTDDQGQNPETQLFRLRNTARARGYEIYDEYIDFKSGKDANRPEFQRLLVDCKGHKVDLIMITKLDRMMRSTSNLLNVIKHLNKWKVGLECLDQAIDTRSAAGAFFVTMLGAIAEFERELTRDRVIDGMNRARAEGKLCHRPKGSTDKKKRKKRVKKSDTPLLLMPVEIGEGD